MAVLTLRILGGFEARHSSGEVAEIPIRKGQALLAFLALNPGGAVARSKLADLLWGDRRDTQAQANLRRTLTVLRKALEPIQDQVLLADRQSVSLDGAGLEVDAVSFQNLIASGTAADLEKAVSLYRGELLEGLDLPDPGLQAWLEDERRRFHDLMAGALSALVALKRMDGAPQDAVIHARRLMGMDPLREDVHCALMALYAELGQRHSVQKQYRRCRELLAGELGVSPTAETEALYQSLLGNDAAGDDPVKVPAGIVVGLPEADDGARAPQKGRSGRAAVAAAKLPRGLGRWAHSSGRGLVTGAMAAVIWLLPWAPSHELSPPDHVPLQRGDVPLLISLSSGNQPGVLEGMIGSSGPVPLECLALAPPGKPSFGALASVELPDVLEGMTESSGPVPLTCLALALLGEPSLAVPHIGNLSGMPEGVTESSGTVSLDRAALPQPDQLSLAVPSPDDLIDVLERATGYSTAIAPPETEPIDEEQRGVDEARRAMQREADGLWPELAESWDLRAVRAFKARYPEARQSAEADLRIAFLIQHNREAQAELNRLGFDAGPVDGIWGLIGKRVDARRCRLGGAARAADGRKPGDHGDSRRCGCAIAGRPGTGGYAGVIFSPGGPCRWRKLDRVRRGGRFQDRRHRDPARRQAADGVRCRSPGRPISGSTTRQPLHPELLRRCLGRNHRMLVSRPFRLRTRRTGLWYLSATHVPNNDQRVIYAGAPGRYCVGF
jgi:DNA-binding SARP family transcriptional activator